MAMLGGNVRESLLQHLNLPTIIVGLFGGVSVFAMPSFIITQAISLIFFTLHRSVVWDLG